MNTPRFVMRVLASAFLGAVFILSCATTGPVRTRVDLTSSSFSTHGLSAFAKENLASFTTFTLSNGLPVIVKKSAANRVQHISLVIRGGSAAASAKTAGFEALGLRTMARGSAAYSYKDIQALLDETSSRIGSGAGFDYSTYSLNTLDKYFSRLFPLWVDTLVRPSFGQADFEQELSRAKLALQAEEQDPWSKTGLVMDGVLFSGHPYGAAPGGTKESLEAVTVDDIKAWYAARMRANVLFVVAVGNFEPAVLNKQLEAGLGELPSSGATLPSVPAALDRSGSGTIAKVEFPQSKGMGYLRGDFSAPPPSDPDYMPLNLGMKILSDLLFNVVRDKYGAVYSPDASIGGFIANHGSITLFKSKNPGKAKAYIDEAVALLAAGKAIAIDSEKSADGYAPLAGVLDALKAQFVNSLYESQATNAAIAGRIAHSAVTTGDYRSFLLDMDRINAVTPKKISAAMDKYLFHSRVTWVVLGSGDALVDVRESDFEGFTAAGR